MTCLLSIGESGHGKTSICQILVRQEIDKGHPPPLVLDPNREPQWMTEHLFGKPENFISAVRKWGKDKNQFFRPRRMVVVDEGYRYLDHYTDEFEWLIREKRHNALHPVVTAHREQDLHKSSRKQANRLFLFRVPPGDAEIFAEDWTSPDLRYAPSLEKYHFLDALPGGPVSLRKISV